MVYGRFKKKMSLMVMVNKSTDHKHEPFCQNYAMQAIKDRLLKVK